MIRILFMLCKEVLSAAKAGQKLPILTIIFLLHLSLHTLIYTRNTSNNYIQVKVLHAYSKIAISINLFMFLIPGYLLLIRLYKHSVTTIFNKEIPPTLTQSIPSFGIHLSLLRPLEIIYRYLTSSYRVLPDIIVLGEVRCGTTSLCQHLASLQPQQPHQQKQFMNCQTPFCLWSHPELDHKETFYFVGHYLGYVTPKHYTMCFPLKFTKWFMSIQYHIKNIIFGGGGGGGKRQQKRTPSFFTFDGCAQYLNSPTAPYLIAEAYRIHNQKPPILISCIRDPIQQTLSWWSYENNAMEWGESIGLTTWNTNLRSENYPPKSIQQALEFTNDKFVNEQYKYAEKYFTLDSLKDDHDCCSNSSGRVKLPHWAMTWPGGQLTGIGRNGKFSSNINRFEKVFHEAFSSPTDDNQKLENNERQNLLSKKKGDFSLPQFQYVNVFPIEYLSDEKILKEFLVDILNKVALRKTGTERIHFEENMKHFAAEDIQLSNVHRNASSKQSKIHGDDINTEGIDMLNDFFASEKKALRDMLQMETVKHTKMN